ncbi:hypothetical protein NI389_01860 [Pseudoalteromonas xiamenensis]|uniref:M61 family metallopeptidase n=1 Tax=Pseudoalteromonas xiamenensis TaxID=882626 RepID=UPI0027E3FB79|nr:hypothetical protein [Pseudoalteromonas xiamenensis]WMN60194.1 hypothetical protein NI389_01860 [Pseudoalteromonas xiamenensis]
MKIIFILLFVFSASSWSVEITWEGLNTFSESQQSTMRNWVHFGLKTNQTVLGDLKIHNLHIDFKGLYFATEPVPWAFVKRENVEAIELHVYRYASLERLKKDWTLYHEIVHLYHPRFATEHFWISEGLATYLQNIIMMKANIITKQEFRSRLSAGFERGKQSTRKHIGKLSSISDEMWSTKAYQRVYWSGAAFFLEADLALREKNNKTLVEVIQNYQNCCRKKSDSAAHFIEALDAISQSAIFSTLFAKYRNRQDFPIVSAEQIRQVSQ